MQWNWQLPNWPNFIYDSALFANQEKKFLQGIGGSFAILKHLDDEKRKQFIVDILCSEGINSAKIEGEILQRDSLQSSIKRQFGLPTDNKKIPTKEKKIGELLWKIYDTFSEDLSHEMLYEWHNLLMDNSSKISDIGKYRTHEEPMQIISSRSDNKTIYFEAPPSKNVFNEMNKFIKWFNDSKEKSVLIKAAITHVYFESIHPFEDGNGRIGRVLVEKSLSQSLNQATLIAVSEIITKRKKEYYEALGSCNKTLNIQKWIEFFADVIVQAQEESFYLINFLMAKSKLMHQLVGKINDRQEKVLLRMFEEGPKGFKGGLSAENYISITKTSRATATRDLTGLVELKVLNKTGELRHTRYWLNINL